MKFFLIPFLLFPTNIFGEYIIHDSIHESPYNLPCLVEALLNTQEDDIHSFSLLYRPKGSLEYLEAPMILFGQLQYIAEIPGNFMVRDQVEYYLLLELSYGKKVTFPQQDAIHNPIIIHIEVPTEKIIPATTSEMKNFDIVGLSPDIMILSPQPGERVRRRDLFIALSYFGKLDVDPTKVRVYLDGLDVSNRADIDTTYLSLSSEDIAPGMHTITVNITNKFDQKFNNINWSFTVLPRNIAESGLIRKQTGSMWANYTGGSVGSYIMNTGELNILYEVDLDFLQCKAQYTKSSLENKYDQPRDRYELNFKNKLLNIKLGDSYPSIDQYALNGHHMRGVNFNFNYGPLLVDIINGHTARAVQGDPSNGAITITEIDTTILLSRNKYTFQQEVLGGKMGIKSGGRFHWDLNFIRVQDNIASVSRELDDAIVTIPTLFESMINEDKIDDFYFNNGVYSIRYDSLMNNYRNLFSEVDSLAFSTKNWIGTKPRDNLIYGSNIKFGFDKSRIQISSGFSVSYMNHNQWNNLKRISELSTIAFDTNLDTYFLNYLQLDTTGNLSQYEKYITFGTNQQPLVPFILQKKGAGIINSLNKSNLIRYITVKLRYLGHRVELGSRRNGPDYYSILNPYLKTNFTEGYFSDRLHLFRNKLLLYYKRSKIIEGIYPEQTSPIEKRKSIFNISLFPGIGLPTINFGFTSLKRSNNENKIIDQITYFRPNSTEPDTITFIRREETVNNLFNIFMTNQFQLWGNQVFCINILLSDLLDKVAENVNNTFLDSIGYMPRDAASESYGISLESIYNRHWESTVYFNSSNYNYGRQGFDYNNDGTYDHINDYRTHNLRHLQINLVYHPRRYVNRVNSGLRYSIGRGSSYIIQYNYKIGVESELLENLIISLNFDYRIKFMDTNNEGTSDAFIRAYLSYNIL